MERICKHFYKSHIYDYCLCDCKPCKYNGNKTQCDEDYSIDPLHEYFLNLQKSVDESSFTDIFPDEMKVTKHMGNRKSI